MESNATDKPVPREVNALLSKERLILRETQRAVTPFGGIAVFISFLEKIGFVGGSAAHADRVAITESYRSKYHVHGVPGIGAVGRQAFRSRQSAAGRSRSACAAGHGPISHRRYDPQSVSPIRYGPSATPLRTNGGMADAAFAAASRGLHAGLGLDRLRTLWPAGRFAQRAQPSQARSSQPSSSVGRAERSAFPPPRLA